MDLYVRLDGNGAHFREAQKWSQERFGRTADPEMFMFKTGLLMCEASSMALMGSMRPVADRVSEPKAYADAVRLSGLARFRSLKKDEQRVLQRLVTCDRRFDMRFNHDVDCEYERLKIEGEPGKGRAKKPAQAAQAAPAAAAAAGFDALMQALVVPQLNWAPHVTPNDTLHIDTFRQVSSVERADPTPLWRVAQEFVPDAPEAPEPRNGGAPKPYTGPVNSLMAKVTFTVTSMPYAPGGGSGIAGMYVRFLIHDEQLNPGAFVEKVIDNCDKREHAAITGGDKRAFGGFREMFPAYARFFTSQHHPAGKGMKQRTWFEHVIKLRPELLDGDGITLRSLEMTVQPSSERNAFHPCNVLTPERACAVAMDGGCDATLMRDELWYNPRTRVASFPAPERAVTYVYRYDQPFWYSPNEIGLMEHMFPHVDVDGDFLATLAAGGNVKRFLQARRYGEEEEDDDAGAHEPRGPFHEIRDMLRTTSVIERSVLESKSLVSYHTNNEFVHQAAAAEVIQTRVAQFKPSHAEQTYREVQELVTRYGNHWRYRIPSNPEGDDLRLRVSEYDIYVEVLEKAQLACTKNFVALWQLDGDLDALPVPEAIRALLKWYRDNRGSKLPNMTRDFVMWDHELGIFGNSMLRSLKLYSCVALILQPIVCLLAEGLFSCYRWAPRELSFNMILHGRYDTGKSFAAITTLLRYTTIEGTVEQYTNATPAADTTQRHVYDMIIACDETMPWKVSKAEADKVPAMVNQEKVKLTSHHTDKKVYAKERGPVGEDVRWARTVHTDHFVSMVEITNATVESTEALTSRYHRLVVAAPQVPARLMVGEMDTVLKDHARIYLRINQFLSAGSYKLIQCGGMLEPDMKLFDDLSNRVIDYLCLKKAIDRASGSRGLEIMRPYAIQCIIHQAIHCVFDMPSSPHYRKEFDPSMLRDMQPFMYATVEIVWWCWTALASGWIDVNNGIVLRAMCVAASTRDFKWDTSMTAYEHYERDTLHAIPWRTHANPAVVNGPGGAGGAAAGGAGGGVLRGAARFDPDARLVDLQYLELRGVNYKQFIGRVVSHTSPRLDEHVVEGIVKVLSNQHVAYPKGGMKPQPAGQFAEWHKYKVVPTPDAPQGSKRILAEGEDVTLMPAAYRQFNADTSVARTVNDVPLMCEGSSGTVIDLSDIGHRVVYFMPQLLASFSNDKIKDALRYATVHKTMRPGKILLGFPSEKDSTQLQIEPLPQEEIIDQLVVDYDKEDGWDEQGNWTDTSIMPEHMRGISRNVGILFNQRTGISKTDAKLITTAPMVPLRDGEYDAWKQKITRATANMQTTQYVSTHLDDDSARRRHLACGRPLDEPVRTQKWIEDEFKAAADRLRRPWTADMDYPWDCDGDNKTRDEQFVAAQREEGAARVNERHAELFRSVHKPRDPQRYARSIADAVRAEGIRKRQRQDHADSSEAPQGARNVRPLRGMAVPHVRMNNDLL